MKSGFTKAREALALLSLIPLAACGTDKPSAPAVAATGVRVVHGAVTEDNPVKVAGETFDLRETEVRMDGRAAQPEDISRGMVVTVRARLDDRGLVAEKVEAEHLLSGELHRGADDALSVSGVRLAVSDDTVLSGRDSLEGFDDGARVRISGMALADGSVLATRIDDSPEAIEAEIEVKGFVSGLTTSGFSLRLSPDAEPSLSISLAAGASLPEGLMEGAFVEVRGSAGSTAGSVIATSVSLEDDFIAEVEKEIEAENEVEHGAEVENQAEDQHQGQGEPEVEHQGLSAAQPAEVQKEHLPEIEFEIEGLVTSGDDARFFIAGREARTSRETEFARGSAAEIQSGTKLRVHGGLDDAGVLEVQKLEIEQAR